jgi:hypothetical protein
MILAAHQPQFMPWLGYFEKMASADVFVLLDDVQFKKNEWQNRNRIWSRQGPQWLTVPVLHEFPCEIRNVRLNETTSWRYKHVQTITQVYGKARRFAEVWQPWEKLYETKPMTLCEINLRSIELLSAPLGVATKTVLSSTLGVEGKSTERLVNLCRKLGADEYLAGAGGHDYMDLSLFEKAGIKVSFQDYKHPVYEQFGGEFVSHLSAFDLICHYGGEAAKIMRSGK